MLIKKAKYCPDSKTFALCRFYVTRETNEIGTHYSYNKPILFEDYIEFGDIKMVNGLRPPTEITPDKYDFSAHKPMQGSLDHLITHTEFDTQFENYDGFCKRVSILIPIEWE